MNVNFRKSPDGDPSLHPSDEELLRFLTSRPRAVACTSAEAGTVLWSRDYDVKLVKLYLISWEKTFSNKSQDLKAHKSFLLYCDSISTHSKDCACFKFQLRILGAPGQAWLKLSTIWKTCGLPLSNKDLHCCMMISDRISLVVQSSFCRAWMQLLSAGPKKTSTCDVDPSKKFTDYLQISWKKEDTFGKK